MGVGGALVEVEIGIALTLSVTVPTEVSMVIVSTIVADAEANDSVTALEARLWKGLRGFRVVRSELATI